jgi:hypothetical protein
LAKQIDIAASNKAKFSLPVMEGIPFEYVIHVPSLPRFATFIFPDYEFFPDQAKHVGITLIKGELRNKYSSISF